MFNFREKYFLLFLGGIGMLLLFFGLLLFAIRKTPAPPPESHLTPKEQAYPTGTSQLPPQKLPTEKPPATGTLVVTSSVGSARVTVGAYPEKEFSLGDFVPPPPNITPFKIERIPVGTYILQAFKQGYDIGSALAVIEEGKITRIEIILRPL